MDTSPDCTGKNVKPQIVRNYRGGDIVLPADPTQVIRAADHPALADQIGNDIITTDGTTLLGADNKAGVAEIMDAAQFLIANPQIKHGAIKILFTPDEEIGRGVDKVDLKKLGADFAYTIDGETAGQYRGRNLLRRWRHHHHRRRQHPSRLCQGQDGARHQDRRRHRRSPAQRPPARPRPPRAGKAFCIRSAFRARWKQATLGFIVRDFTEAGLQEKEALLESIVKEVMQDFPRSSYRLEIKPQYRNMKR